MEFDQLIDAVKTGDVAQAQSLCENMLAKGTPVTDILNLGLVQAMEIIGKGMETGEFFLAEVIMGADTFNKALEVLEPHFDASGPEKLGTAVIGTIFGDIHDVGKDLVASMWEVHGLTVHNIGVDVAAEGFVDAVREYNPDILGISAEITTTMIDMPKVMEALKAAGVRDRVKVMLGGAPLTLDYAKSIGADSYGKDCFDAVVQAKALLGKEGGER
jgi:5-methyltetrahydrofolate--homocysteine methyltransferase